MRVLLDECLPKKLKRELAGHAVVTVPEAGWAGKGNGELMRLAAGQFDVFVTIDQNLTAQQDLANAPFGVVVLVAQSNRFQDLRPLMPKLLEAVSSARAGTLQRVGG